MQAHSSLSGRVLHVGKYFPPFRGGMEVFLADLIDAQRAQGLYAIGLVHGQPLPGDPPWLHRVKVQTQMLYAPMGLGFPFMLRRLVRQFEPDVLHLHMPNNAVFWALLMRTTRGVPWVVHWHSDVVASGRHNKLLALAYKLYQPFENAVLRQASTIIATSPDYLAASAPLQRWRAKCQAIPLGIPPLPNDIATSDGLTEGISEWRPGVLRLLSIGRLTYYKGFETLIDAVSALPGVQLLIAGDGALRGALQARIDASTPPGSPPAVNLLGTIDEARKHRLLQACDLFCLASLERTEAFGIALMEAMQHARPCLVSDLPGSGMPWLVRQTQGGLTVPLQDIDAWRDAISRLQNDPALRARLGRTGHQAVAKQFSMANCADRVARIYTRTSPDVTQVPGDRGMLTVVTTHNAGATIAATVATLRQLGLHQILVVDRASTDHTVSAALAAGVQVLCPVLPTSVWGAIQTGLRHALLHGHRAVLTLDAAQEPTLADIQALLAHARQNEPIADVIIATKPLSHHRADRVAWQWFRRLSRVPLTQPATSLRLYRHDALMVCAAREATLLDSEDAGALILMHKARLSMTEQALSTPQPPAAPKSTADTWITTFAQMTATLILCLSSWRGARPSATQQNQL